ncbi:MAG TPA: AAA domain-containing protein, partial [Gemmatimonadaceae bacterium]
RIARALDHHKAVLVQGPPGTGKSHTIANLVGHLVAHGKRVLVTSHTTKALRVLRGQIVETLRPLCVALLDNDLEGRTQMEEAVKGILTRLTSSTEASLERELSALSENRGEINRRIAEVTNDLSATRESEYLPIVVGGESILPSEAARWVKANEAGNTWIPGPVQASAPLPLSIEELHALYQTNRRVTREEQAEIAAGPPPIDIVPIAEIVSELFEALDAAEPPELSRFWERDASEPELESLERLSNAANAACQHLSHLERWQRVLVGLGHRGGADADLWTQLAALVDDAEQRAQKAKPQLLQYDPQLPTGAPHDDLARIARELEEHLQDGGSLGAMGLLFHGEWKTFIGAARCNGRSPSSLAEFRALRACAELDASRERLGARWTRQTQSIGLPAFASFGAEPEVQLEEYTSQFAGLLSWWNDTWPGVLTAARDAGFQWSAFREREVARSSPSDPFERDVQILSGSLLEAIEHRLGLCKRDAAKRILGELESTLGKFTGPRASALVLAVRARDVREYEHARDALCDLLAKVPIVAQREKLLDKLQPAAPGWASAIQRRTSGHSGAIPTGDISTAWRWRQLSQEIERRAALDEIALTRTLHQLRAELRHVTANVIDRRAWLGQIRRIDLNARQALQGWAQIQKRIGKGTGKRAPTLQNEARGLLAKARDAVPVWIMPLNRVAESFDATKGKFDVVIIDEASQSDVTGLLAWYLGDRVAVVGDHEQVSPTAVGEKIEDVERLIAQHLVDVPNAVLFDGKLSVYDLANQSFGGTIALYEHFRCVPEIIDFSNYLSYNGNIRPLRDPTRVPRPHVIEHVVAAGKRTADGKCNVQEARTIVAIMKALTEIPQYANATMGAISLLGDEQAALIQDLALSVFGAVELARRRFTAGNAAQFQGDERDVMFLSMIDSPNGQQQPLRRRQDDALKQRYNVAASRARDQLWLIHSLDPNRDLHADDLRRRLIEHVRDPSARRAVIQRAQERAESSFERSVLERLISAGYRAEPQVWVGQYRIDIVVSDDDGQVAIECDGDRYHGVDQIPTDMGRQAILERAGWRFIRIRGTRFYRDPDEAMRWVFSELERLEIRPAGSHVVAPSGAEFRDDVVRRAWEIMRKLEWTEPATV